MNRRAQLLATLVLPTVHFLWCLAIQIQLVPPSEGSWTWFPVFLVDFPFSVLPLLASDALSESAGVDLSPFVVFGLTGTVWWYFLSGLVVHIVSVAITRGRSKT